MDYRDFDINKIWGKKIVETHKWINHGTISIAGSTQVSNPAPTDLYTSGEKITFPYAVKDNEIVTIEQIRFSARLVNLAQRQRIDINTYIGNSGTALDLPITSGFYHDLSVNFNPALMFETGKGFGVKLYNNEGTTQIYVWYISGHIYHLDG